MASLVVALALLFLRSSPVFATTGSSACQGIGGDQAGETAETGAFLIGARATIDNQPLTLCSQSPQQFGSGSFQWAAVEIAGTGYNIVQVGYGRCVVADNLPQWGTTNCNGSLYWYWAWGSYCGGSVTGSGQAYGPIPIRIGSAISSPPASTDFYVLRESVSGVEYYDGYANGSLLQGTDALGNMHYARVPASSVCWNTSTTDRAMAWFGETFDDGDSMGGWNSSGARDHLDYNPVKYSVNTGWLTPSNLNPGHPCNSDTNPAIYTCTVVTNSHTYVDTIDR